MSRIDYWKSEAEMCRKFVDELRASGWVVYPEVSDWDFVVVGKTSRIHPFLGYNKIDKDVTIGFQAKLKANFKVLAQALTTSGPTYRYVLVPDGSPEFRAVARHCGVGVVTTRNIGYLESVTSKKPIGDWMMAIAGGQVKEFPRGEKFWLPPIESTAIVPGQPSPRQLTKWRVGAIRLCAVLRSKGFLTQQDFDDHGVSSQRWKKLWLRKSGKVEVEVDGKTKKLDSWVAMETCVLPDVGWDEEAKLLAESSEKP
jgi:hypothetical protein